MNDVDQSLITDTKVDAGTDTKADSRLQIECSDGSIYINHATAKLIPLLDAYAARWNCSRPFTVDYNTRQIADMVGNVLPDINEYFQLYREPVIQPDNEPVFDEKGELVIDQSRVVYDKHIYYNGRIIKALDGFADEKKELKSIHGAIRFVMFYSARIRLYIGSGCGRIIYMLPDKSEHTFWASSNDIYANTFRLTDDECKKLYVQLKIKEMI